MKPTKYEMMVLLNNEFNDDEIKTWSLNYVKTLQKLNASEITVSTRGKLELSYEIKNQRRGNFIEVTFLSPPKSNEVFRNSLKFDSNVLRFLVLNKAN